VYEGGAGGGEKARALRRDLGDLERAEQTLDHLVHASSTQLKQLTELKDNQRYPSRPTGTALCLSVPIFYMGFSVPKWFCCVTP